MSHATRSKTRELISSPDAGKTPKVNVNKRYVYEDLEIEEGYVIAPVKDSYPVKKNIFVMPLPEFIEKMKKKFE